MNTEPKKVQFVNLPEFWVLDFKIKTVLTLFVNIQFSGLVFEQKIKYSWKTSQLSDMGYSRTGEISCFGAHLLQRRKWGSSGEIYNYNSTTLRPSITNICSCMLTLQYF